jgi:hypothetical protein
MGEEIHGPDAEVKPAEEQATLLLNAWINAQRGGSPGPGSGCLSASALSTLAAGTANTEKSRQFLIHLASCWRCRNLEHQISRFQTARLLHHLYLPGLRKAFAKRRSEVMPAVEDLRVWLSSLVTPDSANILPNLPRPILAVSVDDSAKPTGYGGFELESPLSVDRQGRLRISLVATSSGAGDYVIIELQDLGQRLGLCTVPVKESRSDAIVDLSFLQPPVGFIQVQFLALTLASEELALKWRHYEMLPAFRRLVDSMLDPIEIWDNASMILASSGDRWKEGLRDEIRSLDSPSAGVELVRSLVERVALYQQIWEDSNQAQQRQARDLVSDLSEIVEAASRSKRKRDFDTQAETTISPRRHKTERQKSWQSLDPDEQK